MSKILIVVERFYPEDFLVNDLAAEWKRQGHEVEVLTQVPSYPLDKIFDGYENKHFQTTIEIIGDQTISVHRVNTIFGYNRSVKRKILNYLHFGWRTYWWAVWHGRRYDKVFVYHTAALTMASSVYALHGLWYKPITIWTQDLWPDAVWGFGFKPSKWKEALLNSFVRSIYKHCTRITVSCPGFVQRIRELTGREAEFVPQWDTGDFALEPSKKDVDANKPVVFMFAGNLGKPQNLENDIEGFLKAKLPNAQLWLVGGGIRLDELKAKYAMSEDSTVKFLGRQPRAEMDQWFAKADALIISLTEEYRLTLPGKFQSYIKTGKPLLGFISGGTRELIEEHRLGWTAEPGDIDGIAAAYREAEKAVRAGQGSEYGKRAQELSKNKFNRENLIAKLLEV